jgi:hypothetical protein
LCTPFDWYFAHAGEIENKKVFEQHKIPQILQKEEIALFLQRMNWQWKVARKDNWCMATQHPARFGRFCDWSDVTLIYYFDVGVGEKKYYVSGMEITHGTGDHFIRELRFEGVLSLYQDGTIQHFELPLLQIFFGKNGDLNEFHFPMVHGAGGNPDRENCIKWDDKSKVVFDDYKLHGEDFWDAVQINSDETYLDELRKSVESSKSISACPPIKLNSKDSRSINQVRIPKDERYKKLLKKVVEFYDVLKVGGVRKLIDIANFDPMTQSSPNVLFRFEKASVFDVTAIQGLGNQIGIGCYVLFDEKGQIKVWLEGELTDIKIEETKSMKYQINGSGTDIRFHPTGYPASYKTIVNNRLFGRQIEWNDKGEVLSDVDLDIPKPWADAPKKEEDGGQKK